MGLENGIVGMNIARLSLKPTNIREGIKKLFFWEISPKCGWVGWLISKQGPNPSKSPENCPFFTQKSPFVLPNLTKTLGWVNRFGRSL